VKVTLTVNLEHMYRQRRPQWGRSMAGDIEIVKELLREKGLPTNLVFTEQTRLESLADRCIYIELSIPEDYIMEQLSHTPTYPY